MRIITENSITAFENSLYLSEKSAATISKYVRSVSLLAEYLAGKELTNLRLMEYREQLASTQKAQTVNGNLTAIHAYLTFRQWEELKIRQLKIQRKTFLEENRELTKAEYKRLLGAARGKNIRLYYLMMTLCSTGIRISELHYITVHAVQVGRADIRMKGKCRTILIPKKLCANLLRYCRQQGIHEGVIFRTKSGRAVDRSNIFHEMKRLCREAAVEAAKVFPHNFRHLFARMFYAVEKNLSLLADVLGHSRIETTRIYVAASSAAHQQILDHMDLVE